MLRTIQGASRCNVSDTGTAEDDGTTTSKELNSNSLTASVVVGLKKGKGQVNHNFC